MNTEIAAPACDERLNLSRVSNTDLVMIITLTNPLLKRKNGLVRAADIAVLMIDRIILRQRAINVLVARMRGHLDKSALGRLFSLDRRFAIVFVEEHLGLMDFVFQEELALRLNES